MRRVAYTALLATLFFFKPAPEVVPLKPNESILAFGDSITYGFGVEARESYPSVLHFMTGIRVINAGINGETSEEGLARLPMLLEDDSIRLMLLCFGANDILQQRSMERLRANLVRMIALAKSKGVDVILIGVPEFRIPGLASLPLYDGVAEAENVAYMPSLLPDVLEDRSLKADDVHPNAAGYRQMAERIAERLRKIGYIDSPLSRPRS